jgi:hypothetical protein
MAASSIDASSGDSSGKFDGFPDFPDTIQGTYTCIIRQVTHMIIRRFILILVQTLEAAYSIVATGRNDGGHDEPWLTFATTD